MANRMKTNYNKLNIFKTNFPCLLKKTNILGCNNHTSIKKTNYPYPHQQHTQRNIEKTNCPRVSLNIETRISNPSNNFSPPNYANQHNMTERREGGGAPKRGSTKANVHQHNDRTCVCTFSFDPLRELKPFQSRVLI